MQREWGGFQPLVLLDDLQPLQDYYDQFNHPDSAIEDHLAGLNINGPERDLNLIVAQCIEFEFQQALDLALEVESEGLNPEQNVVFQALVAGLYFLLGHNQKAKNRYEGSKQAAELLKKTKRREHFLTMVDHALAMCEDKLDWSFNNAKFGTVPRSINPYEFHGRRSADEFLNEAFKAWTRTENSSYARNGFPQEIREINLALLYAWVCGDVFRARNASVTFAKQIILQYSGVNNKTVAYGIRILLQVGHEHEFDKVLGKVHHELHPLLNLDELFLTYRPGEALGQAGQRYWKNLVDLIYTFSPYVADTTLNVVTTEIVEVLVAVFQGGADHTYMNSWWKVIHMFESHLTPTLKQELEVFRALAHSERVNGEFWWEVFSNKSWKEIHRPLAREMVDFLTAEASPAPETSKREILMSIAHDLPGFETQLFEWYQQDPAFEHLRWMVLLYSRIEAAARDADSWFNHLIDKLQEEYRIAIEQDQYTIGGPIFPALLEPLLKHYGPEISSKSRKRLKDLIKQTVNTEMPAVVASLAYRALSQCLQHLGDVQDLRKTFEKHDAALMGFRASSSVFDKGSDLTVRLEYLRFKLQTGGELSQTEWQMLVQVLAEGKHTPLRKVLQCFVLLIDRGERVQQIVTLLSLLLEDPDVVTKAGTVATVMHSKVMVSSEEVHQNLPESMIQQIPSSHPYITQTFLVQLFTHPELLKGAFGDQLQRVVIQLENNEHRQVRNWAKEISSRFMNH